MYKYASLKEYLCINNQSFTRFLSNTTIDYNEDDYLKLRKNSRLDEMKKKKLIPLDFTQEEYTEFMKNVNKYKKCMSNKKYRKSYVKSDEYKKRDNEKSKMRYYKNLERSKDYYKTIRQYKKYLPEHYSLFSIVLTEFICIQSNNSILLKTIRSNINQLNTKATVPNSILTSYITNREF